MTISRGCGMLEEMGGKTMGSKANKKARQEIRRTIARTTEDAVSQDIVDRINRLSLTVTLLSVVSLVMTACFLLAVIRGW